MITTWLMARVEFKESLKGISVKAVVSVLNVLAALMI